jgi:hypothetical protein
VINQPEHPAGSGDGYHTRNAPATRGGWCMV